MPDAAEPVVLLDQEGQRIAHPDYSIDVTSDEVRGLYRDMVLIRRIDLEGTALQRQGQLGLWAPSLGQEAAQVGSARALRAADMAFPTYREHGVAWLRGVGLESVTGVYRGTTHGGWDPQAVGVALFMIVIGDQCPQAVGYAMGQQRDGADAATLVYLGDGATSQGDVHESMVFASVFHAPTVFFCTNNQWAISAPTERQSRVPLSRRADGYGFPGVRVDGNDVLAVLSVTRAALSAARDGQGPALIEACTYRMGAHTTSDDPTRYRTADEVDYWRQRDPIDRVERYLRREGMADDDFFASVAADADRVGAEVREVVLTMVPPPPSRMFEHVYAEPHAGLDRERREFMAYAESFELPEGP